MHKFNSILISIFFLLFVTACGGRETPPPAADANPTTVAEPSPTPQGKPEEASAQVNEPTAAPAATGATRFIVFASEQTPSDPESRDIFTIDTSGQNWRNLTGTPGQDITPDWSPDGSQIAWASERDNNLEIYTMKADGSNVRRLTQAEATDTLPDWAPDGQTLAFASERDGNWEIYVMGADGADPHNLTQNEARDSFPDWSPDGTRLLFASDRGENRDIYVMNADGSNVIRLTDDAAEDDSPRWSPDGSQIIFTSARDGNEEIYLMNGDGSNQRRLTDDLPRDIRPAWSPDNRHILWHSNRTGPTQLYVMNVDGSNYRRLIDSPGNISNAKIQPGPAELIAFGGEPVESQTTYVDLSPFVLGINIGEDSTVHLDGKVYQGDSIDIILDPQQVRLPQEEQTDEDNFIISEGTPIFSVLRTSSYDVNPTLHIGTKAELPAGAVLNIMPGEITLADTGESPAFFLNLPDQTLTTAPTAPTSTASDSLAGTEKPAVDLAAAVDLAPFVTETSVDMKSWDHIGYESYIELVLDSTSVKGIDQGPANDKTARNIENFSVVLPEAIAAVVVETSWYDTSQEFKLGIWLEKDIPNAVLVHIAAGELEVTQSDGQVTTGPFVVQVANTATAPVVMAADTPLPSAEAAVVPASGEEPLVPVLVNDKWGFMNKTGQMVIAPQFDNVHAFVFPTFVDNLEPVMLGAFPDIQWGYIDRTGQFVIEPQFLDGRPFAEGLARVKVGEKYGYIDLTGQIVIEPQFDSGSPFVQGVALVTIDKKPIYIDTTGQPISSLSFDEAYVISKDGLAEVRIGNLWGFVDTTGQLAIEPQFEHAYAFSEGLAPVQVAGKWGYINKTGQMVIEPRFDSFRYFNQGIAAVKQGNKWGYIDITGQVIIEPQFDIAGDFSEGVALAHIKDEEFYGYIEPTGEVAFQLAIEFPDDPQQKERMKEQIILGNFNHGLAMIKFTTGKYGYVDRAGNYIWHPLTGAAATTGDAGSAGDTLVLSTPTPAAAPASAATPPALTTGEGAALAPQQYILLALATSLKMFQSVKEVLVLVQNPPTDRDILVQQLTPHVEVVRTAHAALTQMNPPADLQDEHAVLLEGSAACLQTVSLMTDGIQNLSQETINSAGPYKNTCTEKVTQAAVLLQNYANSAAK